MELSAQWKIRFGGRKSISSNKVGHLEASRQVGRFADMVGGG